MESFPPRSLWVKDVFQGPSPMSYWSFMKFHHGHMDLEPFYVAEYSGTLALIQKTFFGQSTTRTTTTWTRNTAKFKKNFFSIQGLVVDPGVFSFKKISACVGMNSAMKRNKHQGSWETKNPHNETGKVLYTCRDNSTFSDPNLALNKPGINLLGGPLFQSLLWISLEGYQASVTRITRIAGRLVEQSSHKTKSTSVSWALHRSPGRWASDGKTSEPSMPKLSPLCICSNCGKVSSLTVSLPI